MNTRLATVLLWTLSLIITLSAAAYQRMTGPTYPVSSAIDLSGVQIEYELPRSEETNREATVRVSVGSLPIHGLLRYRRYKSNDPWAETIMERRDDELVGTLPKQPPAGKVMYTVELTPAGQSAVQLTEQPVILRYKGAVPLYVLIPHVLLMFAAMMLSTRTALEAIFARNHTLRLTVWTTGCLLIGGMILGPVVQKFAFGAFWTGWPFGTDLTDNKTAIAFVAWIVALVRVWREPGRRWSPIIAAVILLAVYSIPHSMFGSELDYTQIENSNEQVSE